MDDRESEFWGAVLVDVCDWCATDSCEVPGPVVWCVHGCVVATRRVAVELERALTPKPKLLFSIPALGLARRGIQYTYSV